MGARVFDFRREPEALLKRLDEASELGRQNGLPVFTSVLVPLYSLSALIQKGQIAEGKAALAAWEGAGYGIDVPGFKSVLAEGIAQLGDLDAALALLDEAIAQVEEALQRRVKPGPSPMCSTILLDISERRLIHAHTHNNIPLLFRYVNCKCPEREVFMRKRKTRGGSPRETKLLAHPLKQFCSSIGISYDSGRRAIARGDLRTIRFGSLILVPAEEAERVMSEGLRRG